MELERQDLLMCTQLPVLVEPFPCMPKDLFVFLSGTDVYQPFHITAWIRLQSPLSQVFQKSACITIITFLGFPTQFTQPIFQALAIFWPLSMQNCLCFYLNSIEARAIGVAGAKGEWKAVWPCNFLLLNQSPQLPSTNAFAGERVGTSHTSPPVKWRYLILVEFILLSRTNTEQKNRKNPERVMLGSNDCNSISCIFVTRFPFHGLTA